MSPMDNLKDRLRGNFPGLFKKKGTAGAGSSANAAPTGLQLKGDVESSVAGLSKNLIVGVAVVLALAILGVWYGITHVKPTMTTAHSGSGPVLASKNNVATPKSYAPAKEPAPAAVASGAASAPASQHSTVASAGSPNEAAQTQTQQQPTPQMQAVQRALSAEGASGGGWATAAAPKRGQTASTNASRDRLAVSPGGMGGTGTPTALNPINSQSGLGVYDTHLVRKPASPFEVMQGSVIPATLTTGIQSDLPGQITAVVARNVFDSASGASLLIPAGAQLVGSYSSKVLPGQSSVAVAWNRIIFPNGSYINLGTMPGTDPNGMSGISGDVDNHTWLMFKNALLLSLVGTGIQAATPQSTGVNGSMSTAQIFQSQLANTFGQAVSQILQRYMSIAPTIHVQPGAQIAVVVSKDLVFPGPYTSRMQAAPQRVRDTAIPAMINPYPAFGDHP